MKQINDPVFFSTSTSMKSHDKSEQIIVTSLVETFVLLIYFLKEYEVDRRLKWANFAIQIYNRHILDTLSITQIQKVCSK